MHCLKHGKHLTEERLLLLGECHRDGRCEECRAGRFVCPFSHMYPNSPELRTMHWWIKTVDRLVPTIRIETEDRPLDHQQHGTGEQGTYLADTIQDDPFQVPD